jgi:hypothetical protein
MIKSGLVFTPVNGRLVGAGVGGTTAGGLTGAGGAGGGVTGVTTTAGGTVGGTVGVGGGSVVVVVGGVVVVVLQPHWPVELPLLPDFPPMVDQVPEFPEFPEFPECPGWATAADELSVALQAAPPMVTSTVISAMTKASRMITRFTMTPFLDRDHLEGVVHTHPQGRHARCFH